MTAEHLLTVFKRRAQLYSRLAAAERDLGPRVC
jgi:hypothetical protein